MALVMAQVTAEVTAEVKFVAVFCSVFWAHVLFCMFVHCTSFPGCMKSLLSALNILLPMRCVALRVTRGTGSDERILSASRVVR